MKSLTILAVAVPLLLSASAARGQSNLQAWGNLSLNRGLSERWTGALEFEPKVLAADNSGGPGWWSMDATPNVEFVPKHWLDVIAELPVTYTSQTDGVDSWEVSPRGGLRVHLFSRDVPDRVGRLVAEAVSAKERPPKRRLVIRDRLLVEQRNLVYNNGKPSSHTWRVRNRLELQFPLNRTRVTEDDSWTLLTDWEWFVPLDDPSERFANRQRIRGASRFGTASAGARNSSTSGRARATPSTSRFRRPTTPCLSPSNGNRAERRGRARTVRVEVRKWL